MRLNQEWQERVDAVHRGGQEKYHQANAEKGKLPVRERIRLLLDEDVYEEDGLFAAGADRGLPADGVVTGTGKMHGRMVCFMANDSTVKAGSWGPGTVEKIIRIQETAEELGLPMMYLVDSAGARITDQVEMFPNRRGAGRIFHQQIKMSGVVPQVCVLFGPSAAGGAYMPAFCDVVVMVEGNASMYLGSPRMAEMVIGEKVSLEEMGGARMHCSVSGCGDMLAENEEEAILAARTYMTYMPDTWKTKPASTDSKPPVHMENLDQMVPENQNAAFDMLSVIHALVDEDSWFEIKALFAKELLTGFARIDGRVVGIVANQPKQKGGVLFPDSADKAARFIHLCDAFQVPLLFLMDVPGFMIGSKVERAGIIRHGAKMVAAMSQVRVPKLSVIVRKAYGAGLYAMAGPAFEPDWCIALPTAKVAVMGPEAAVNAVYANKIAALPENERAAFIEEKRKEYQEHVDIYHLASELIVDDILPMTKLRSSLAFRLEAVSAKDKKKPAKHNPVYPV
ncbi:acyl-CoA carboxylase subunit beta [Alkalicoccus urumqiensis]|uniref:Carboxylase n=1 Tax=Alkalicoccus urumqiensis TaxID=1548213 RepID=A0A2P6MEE3_ALKUR|nr:acyl-CoA carboxylase subunit beta [Alkalicoccus urumqiensis]PRO64655.1 carboxylase [Alkalicoccus urumqiensis]